MSMSVQLKQRIIGIVVLIFLGLIILPWMFGQNHPDVFKNHESPKDLPEVVKETTSLKPPVPDPVEVQQQVITPQPSSGVYTSDQEDSAAVATTTTAPIPQAAPVEPPVSVSVPTVKAEEPQVTSTKVTTKRPHSSELESSRIANIENGIIKTKSITKKPSVIKTKPVAKETVELNEPDLAKLKLAVAKTTSKPSKKSGRGFLIQLGSFSNKANADKLVKQLESKNYHVYSVTSKNNEGNDVTKVIVGPESDRQAVNALKLKINKLVHINGIIVKG